MHRLFKKPAVDFHFIFGKAVKFLAYSKEGNNGGTEHRIGMPENISFVGEVYILLAYSQNQLPRIGFDALEFGKYY